mmetsp:Transcript_45441/g.68572  ORF Transcript_45441/g.68572 Transcript_45441/m.68572 type:complete len:211 (+) Transcript_45441:320-952(+)
MKKKIKNVHVSQQQPSSTRRTRTKKTATRPPVTRGKKRIVQQQQQNITTNRATTTTKYTSLLMSQTKLACPTLSYSRVLPPSVQLLFSLIRSDWDTLDYEMNEFVLEVKAAVAFFASVSTSKSASFSPTGKRKRRNGHDSKMVHSKKVYPTLFPPELSLEQLYCRIRGASAHHIKSNARFGIVSNETMFDSSLRYCTRKSDNAKKKEKKL